VKIQRLRLAGFGPYKGEQRVDFERFADDGIFLITGKTGAGKSSILDAICFALYDSIPRYESTQQSLRSDHAATGDPTFVELEFTVADTAYRVNRTPAYERPKARGIGTTTAPATAELARNEGAGWEVIAAKPVDVGKELARIVGLTKDQFLQVILLAQNRFQQFLKANNDDRQAVLRTLFGTRRFESLESAFAEKRKALEARLGSSTAVLDALATDAARLAEPDNELELSTTPEWFDGVLASTALQHALTVASTETADAEFALADRERASQADARARQVRRDRAREQLAVLQASEAAIVAGGITLESAHRAQIAWPHVETHRGAVSRLATLEAAETAARESYSAALGAEHTSVTAESLVITIDETTRSLGALADALADEKALGMASGAVERAVTELEAAESRVTAGAVRVAELPLAITAIADAITPLRAEAARLDGAAEAEKRGVALVASARTAASLEESLVDASAREAEASRAHSESATRVSALVDQRLTGHAAELASALVAGEACAVCGAIEHPHPATANVEPVTEEDIETARAALDVDWTAVAAAKTARDKVSTSLAEARGATSGRSLDELETELADARVTLKTATAAVATLAARERELASLTAALESARDAQQKLVDARETAARSVAVLTAERDALEKRVSAQRGDYASIAERVAELQLVLELARTLDGAIDRTNAGRNAVASALAVLTEQLAENGFESDDDVAGARRDGAERARLESGIRQHEQGIAAANATLADDELVGLAEEPIDLTDVQATFDAARTARDSAISARSSSATRLAELERIVREAHAQHEATAALAAEYAQVRELANVISGLEPNTKRMRLETYVLAAQLEEIVEAANARLRTMTSGRYTLEHDDSIAYKKARSGLGLSILDQHTGRSRATHSLSGGETFLASLALALGLAEVVTNQSGGITLDTLFIDEGFGSLDADTLDIAMSTLDSLRAGGRIIGLISHVETMKEQITAKLRITVSDDGSSAIEPQSATFAG